MRGCTCETSFLAANGTPSSRQVRTRRCAARWVGRAAAGTSSVVRRFGRRSLFVAFVGLWGGGNLQAHDAGLSAAQGVVHANQLELTVGFAGADVQRLLLASRPVAREAPGPFQVTKADLDHLARELWEVRAGGRVVAPIRTHVDAVAGDGLNFTCIYPRPPGGRLTLCAAELSALPATHREFVMITDARGLALAGKLLSATNRCLDIAFPVTSVAPGPVAPSPPSATVPAPAAPDGSLWSNSPFFGFLRLGVEHIWTGYDHLLFLFGLLVVCRSLRSILAISSCFTVAHSLTLGLAALDVVHLPSRIIEPAIAASIVFVGVENLVRRGAEPRGRWAVTFAFGLVHGFGFASVLRERGVGSHGVGAAIPLFTFNLGVEIGQVVIAVLVLPVVWQLRKQEWFVRRGVPALSAAIAAAGLYWLLERTFLQGAAVA